MTRTIVRGDSVYAETARFNTGRALTEDEMRASCPSIFANSPHESRSERFQAIPTIDVVRALGKEGFEVVGAKQSVCRMDGKADYTKHLLRLRRMDNLPQYSVGDTVCEMLLKNANDGTACYDLMAGLFRILCLNSMVALSNSIEHVKVRHTGDVIPQVIDGTFRVLGEAQKALVAPREWSQVILDAGERGALAEAAHHVRFADSEGNIETTITPGQLLAPRRRDDVKQDLWSVFNVVQENTIKGGLHGIGLDANGHRRRFTTRQVKGIDADVKLNKALWLLGERMAELKS